MSTNLKENVEKLYTFLNNWFTIKLIIVSEEVTMKTYKKVLMALIALTIVAICLAIPQTAKAAGEKTYTVHWDGSNWFYQTNLDSSWVGIETLAGSFNAGDSIIVDGQSQSGLKTCEITLTQGTGDVCSAGGATTIINVSGGTVGKAYAVIGGTLVVNGDVNLATPTGTGVLQVNGNVTTLEANYDNGVAKYAVTGTVGKAFAKINSETPDTFYSIKAGKMNPDANGIVWLNDGEYSKTPGAAPAPTPNNKPANNDDDLDDVPKTGSFALESSIALLILAAFMGTGAVLIFRKKKEN